MLTVPLVMEVTSEKEETQSDPAVSIPGEKVTHHCQQGTSYLLVGVLLYLITSMVVVLAAITAMHSRQAAMRWEGGLGREENLQKWSEL